MQSSSGGTIIDELVITLGLDPRGFNQGQRQAIGQLRAFQQQANTSSNQIQSGAGSRLQRFWQNLGKPIGQAQQNLTNLGAQSNRVGTQIAAGINQGSVSLSRMTTAALAAYGAIKTVQGAVKNLNDAIAYGAQTGRTAGYTGVSTSYMSNLAIGANISNNANIEQTQQTMFQLRQFAEAANQGQLNENQAQFLGRLGALGIALDTKQDPETMQRQLLQQLHERLRTMTQPQAQFFGSQLGFSREFTQALQQHGPQQLEQIGAPYGVTARQAEQFAKLQSAINAFSNSWDAFIRKMIESNPELERGIKGMADWLTDLRNSPQAMDAVVKGLEAIVALIGVRLVAAVATFVASTVAQSAVFAKTPLGVLLMAAMGLRSFVAAPTPAAHEAAMKDPTSILDPRRWFGIGPYSSKTDDRSLWERWAPKSLGGKNAPVERRNDLGKTIPIPGQQGNYTPSQLRQFALAAGFQGDAATQMAAISYSESKGDPNAVSKTNDYGLTQVNAAAHGEALAKSTLGNPAKAFAEAYRISKGGSDFTPWSDYKNKNYEQYMGQAGAGGPADVASSFWGAHKGNPALGAFISKVSNLDPKTQAWCAAFANATLAAKGIEGTPSNVANDFLKWGQGVPTNQVKRDDVIVRPQGAGPGQVGGHVGIATGETKGNLIGMVSGNTSGGKVDFSWEDPSQIQIRRGISSSIPNYASNITNGMSLVGSANAAMNAAGNVNNNTSSIGIGDVHVHTQATDARGMARDVRGELSRSLDVTNSNYGLQY